MNHFFRQYQTTPRYGPMYGTQYLRESLWIPVTIKWIENIEQKFYQYTELENYCFLVFFYIIVLFSLKLSEMLSLFLL